MKTSLIIINSLRLFFLFLFTCLLSLIAGIGLFLKKGDEIYFFFARFWARVILKVCFIHVRIRGFERVPNPKGLMYLSNHASMFDIWALQANLPGQLRFVGKKELVKIPIFGWIWKYSGNIPIDRKSPRKFYKSLQLASKTISEGKNIILYPEGTRTKDGKIGDFKRGAFSLAVRSKAIIVPITINGSYNIKTGKSLIVNPAKVEIIIHDPIYLSECWNGRKKEVEIMQKIKEIISNSYINQ